MTTSGIWNHATPANLFAANSAARPAAATASSASSGDGGANISSNDFLTLLVTEMQNQDPTANTDPNEYINQLVQVNSLEQLISINQALSTDSSSGTSATGGVQPGPTTNSIAEAPTNTASRSTAPPSNTGQANSTIAGNLSLPPTAPAAQRVAHALTRTGND